MRAHRKAAPRTMSKWSSRSRLNAAGLRQTAHQRQCAKVLWTQASELVSRLHTQNKIRVAQRKRVHSGQEISHRKLRYKTYTIQTNEWGRVGTSRALDFCLISVMWTGMPPHKDHRRLAAPCATLLLGMLFRWSTQFHPVPLTLLPWPLDLASTSVGPSPSLSHCSTFISL